MCWRVREHQDPQHGQRGRHSVPTIICKSFLQVFKQVGNLEDHHLYVRPGESIWSVANELNSTSIWLRGGRANTTCPAHPSSCLDQQGEASRVPQLTCIWMSVGRRNARTQSNLTLAASGAFKSSRTPQKIHF